MNFKINPFAIRQEELRKVLINKILDSKRLLVEHVELLRLTTLFIGDCFEIQENHADKIVNLWPQSTAGKSCILIAGTADVLRNLPPPVRAKLMPFWLVAGGLSVCSLLIHFYKNRKHIVDIELDKLIQTFKEFENCIRRYIIFFNEIQILNPQEPIEGHYLEHALDCIDSIKMMAEILFNTYRHLEVQYPVPDYFSFYYTPMEDLRECEFFAASINNFNSKHIKNFYNILLYVESQLLLYLGICIFRKAPLNYIHEKLRKVNCHIRELVVKEENHFKNLIFTLNKNQLSHPPYTVNYFKPQGYSSDKLQYLSFQLDTRMIAIAYEFNGLQIYLQGNTENNINKRKNSKQLEQILYKMHSIENAFKMCFDDFQALILLYNKFMNIKSDVDNSKNIKYGNDTQDIDDEFHDSFLRVEISDTPTDTATYDDFYAYVYDEELNKKEKELLAKGEPEKYKEELEILNFERRFTKNKFQPVLKQLKDRIEPIRQTMMEKEREVLAAKGINADEFSNDDGRYSEVEYNDTMAYSGTESSVSDFQFGKHAKKIRDHDTFAEMRNFLAQKQNINLFKLDLPPSTSNALGGEDILESES